MIRTTLRLSILITLLYACSEDKKTTFDFAITNVGFFDGTTDHGIVNLALWNDTIVYIGKEAIAADSILDGTNKYLVPGLINSHVHATSPADLKEALNSGIMAVIDLHQSSEERAAELRSYRDSLNYAYFASAGFSATLPGGHPTQYGPIETISDSLSADQWVQNRIENGADFIKIIRDAGGGPPDFQAIPTLSFQQIQELATSARQHQKMSIVHTVTVAETMKVLKFGIDGLAHLWFGNETVSDEQLKTLSESGVFVIPTAQTQEKIWGLVADGPPEMKAYAKEHIASMEGVKSELLRLHQAGVRILAGNDAPNFGINYGNDLLAELAIYKEAGISNREVLQTVTGNPSDVFGLEGIGTIQQGAPANMLLIDGNPIEDLSTLQKIEIIWRDSKRVE